MNRVHVLQTIIDRLGARRYLEIGVQSGDTLFPLRVRKKLAVDPRFLITTRAKLDWVRWNFCNIFNSYYEMTSDMFFSKHGGALAQRGLDVVFVDGLHTYEQSLKDVENSLRYLSVNGVIVMDDCNPPSEGAAAPSKAPDQMVWTGDVWKTVAFLRSTRADLNVVTLDCVYGIGIVVRGTPETRLAYMPHQISSLTYTDLDADRERILNLKTSTYLNELVATL